MNNRENKSKFSFEMIVGVIILGLVFFAIYTNQRLENEKASSEVQACSGEYKMSQSVYDAVKESEMRQWLELPYEVREELVVLMIRDTNIVSENDICAFPIYELVGCMNDAARNLNLPNYKYTQIAEGCAESLRLALERDV